METMLITKLATFTGEWVYYTDFSNIFWFLGVQITLLVLIYLKHKIR